MPGLPRTVYKHSDQQLWASQAEIQNKTKQTDIVVSIVCTSYLHGPCWFLVTDILTLSFVPLHEGRMDDRDDSVDFLGFEEGNSLLQLGTSEVKERGKTHRPSADIVAKWNQSTRNYDLIK